MNEALSKYRRAIRTASSWVGRQLIFAIISASTWDTRRGDVEESSFLQVSLEIENNGIRPPIRESDWFE
jgi:hypothetical protein